MFFPSTKHLPKDLTSYDLLKSFAVITMVIDHIGMYLFPDQNEWRVIGRMSMPVWLFLIGYARSRDLSALLWVGGSILILSNITIGEPFLPVNILFTILIVRVFLDVVMKSFLSGMEPMLWTTLSVVILVFPMIAFFDYGTHAFLFAMFGYLVRHQKELSLPNIYVFGLMGLAVVVHSLSQQVIFGFNYIEALVAAVGILLVCLYMTNFKSKTYPSFSAKSPVVVTGFLKFMGRYSLEIYVIHLLFLKMIAFFMFPENFGLFQWNWM